MQKLSPRRSEPHKILVFLPVYLWAYHKETLDSTYPVLNSSSSLLPAYPISGLASLLITQPNILLLAGNADLAIDYSICIWPLQFFSHVV